MTGKESFRSLFLPLSANESGIFAAVVSLFGPREPATESATPLSSGRTSKLQKPVADSTNSETSALFTTLSARADAILVVLRNREVIYYGLSDPRRGPVERHRFAPTPTVLEAGAATSCPGGATAKAAAAFSSACCAALIPLSLSYSCRVQPPGDNSSRATTYLRGVIGCRDGRVSVFSETAYAYGFAAHDTPVVYVAALHVHPSECGEEPTLLAKPNVRDASQHLGFITVGMDGVMYLWRRHAEKLKPSMVTEGRQLNRYFACCVHQPAPFDWTILAATSHGGLAPDPEDGARTSCGPPGEDTALFLPRPILMYVPSQLRRELVLQHVSVDAAPVHLEVMPLKRDKDRSRAGLAETIILPMPGSWWHRASAVATDGNVYLVANHHELYTVGWSAQGLPLQPSQHHPQQPTRCVFTAKHRITHLRIQNGIITASCLQEGYVYVLRLPNFDLVATYRSYAKRSLTSVELYAPANLLLLVDAAHGSVELVAFPIQPTPDVGFFSADGTVAPTEEPIHDEGVYSGSVMVLRHKCQLDDARRQQQAQGHPVPVADGALQGQMAACEESLYLARLGIPKACDDCVHRSNHFL